MLQINVALANGHAELMSLLPSSTVQDLRTKALWESSSDLSLFQ